MERALRSTFQANVTYDAVIVLGGSLDAVLSKEHGQLEYNNAVDRLLKGYALYKSGHARNILLAGGNTFPMEGVPPESAFHAKQLREWGVEPAHLVSEQESRNTYENAVETAKLTRARGWTKLLLITSAAHMPRAEGCFRAAGLQVDTLPVDHRGTRAWEKSILPRASSLAMSTDALRELAGRWVYRLRGFSQP